MSSSNHSRLHAWIDHVFDRPIPDDPKAKEWYWADDAPAWECPPEEVPPLIAETCEHGGELLAGFSDAQLDQGFWYLFGPRSADFTDTLIDLKIPLPDRIRAIRSFTPLFEQVMAIRCSSWLGHLDEPAESSLTDSCYMWWDWLWHSSLSDRIDAPMASEIVEALRRQLTIPHDACRESALHGIGHWGKTIPEVVGLVDEFLVANPGLRPELVAYAEEARIVHVQ